jgi:DNA-binding beta-propeller fold protein YncE
VINAATCNATDPAGCGTTATLHVPGGHPDGITVDAATSTIYVATITSKGPNLVSVFNAATCNAASTAGCGQAPAVLKVGNSGGGPSNSALSLAVDQATDTIYTANIADGEHPGTVSVINGASCNGPDHAGCRQTPASVAAGFGSVGVAIDPATDGATCNGSDTAGCSQAPPRLAVGDYPSALAVDPAAGTAYVASGTENTVSVIPLTG